VELSGIEPLTFPKYIGTLSCKKKGTKIFVPFSGAKRDRTADLLNAIQALSQLSYSPIKYNINTIYFYFQTNNIL
jgi:hypothetical protein